MTVTSTIARRQMQNTLSVKRPPTATADGQIGEAELVYADVPCGELDPSQSQVANEMRNQAGTENPIVVKELFLEGDYAVQNGDFLVIDSTEYPVRAVELFKGNHGKPDTRRITVVVPVSPNT